jgi:uncharacterized protein
MLPAIVPPFDEESARAKVQRAEDLWNTRDPEKVALTVFSATTWRPKQSTRATHWHATTLVAAPTEPELRLRPAPVV